MNQISVKKTLKCGDKKMDAIHQVLGPNHYL